ncbi:MAG: nucleotide sugar dehydrogenase [Acidimicrobiales bacterium]
MNVAVFGLGYVGTVTAAILAAHDHEVRAVDVDPPKVRLVASGRSPVSEPGLDELVAAGAVSGRLRATRDAGEALAGARLSLVCVGTPSSSIGSTDLRHVLAVIDDIGRSLAAEGSASPHAVVIRSTVPPGTVEDLLTPRLRSALAGAPVRVGIGMCPELLREGSAIADFYDSPITVLGTDDHQVVSAVEEVLGFLGSPVRVVAPREAEALKYACNAFHATKISFVNELGRLLRLLGVDARRVMTLFCEDTKLNLSARYLAPGFAFGGSCLPKDLRSLLYLARANFVDLPLLAGTMATNQLSIADVVNRVVATDARTIALLGITFKMLSDDVRESPYVDLAETLIGKGFDVRIHDPAVDVDRMVGENRRYFESKLPHVRRALRPSAADALDHADLALVSSSDPAVVDALVQHPPPRTIDLNGRLGPIIEGLPGYEGVVW